jgi:hypothetical protein
MVAISTLAAVAEGSGRAIRAILSSMLALRTECAAVARRARSVAIERARVDVYAAGLPRGAAAPPDPAAHLLTGSRETLTAFWLTLDAINFGSGWFPTLAKRGGRSGYLTIATGLRERFAARGPFSAAELSQIDVDSVAAMTGQDPAHELMGLFAVSLRDLGRHVAQEHGGRFASVADSAGGSAVALALMLGGWAAYADSSGYEELTVGFLKRAQIAAADLARAGVVGFDDLRQLTLFADNLVPHVLRLDGILTFTPELVARIERGELIEHGSSEEVEIRACALHAVELIVAARADTCAAEVDQLLWHRGQQSVYKASPRHRSRCTAY